jgi:hypothetical protein
MLTDMLALQQMRLLTSSQLSMFMARGAWRTQGAVVCIVASECNLGV